MQRHRLRQGSALLEVMIALAILGITASSLLVLTSQSMRAVAQVRAADADMSAASAFFDAVALWTRDDLDRHLGDRAQGPWRMHVGRPAPTLYVVTLADSGAPRRVLLSTALFRPETPR